jgi:hypothetical protein
MRGAGSRSLTHATHGVPCLACTGESNCPQLAKNNLIIRQCKWSTREDTPPIASQVANMDMVEVIVGVLLLLLGTGVVHYLLQQRTQLHARRSEIEQDFRRQSEIQREFLRVFAMTNAQGKEGLIKRWMDRSGCDRTEAMRLATEERRRDNR